MHILAHFFRKGWNTASEVPLGILRTVDRLHADSEAYDLNFVVTQLWIRTSNAWKVCGATMRLSAN